MDDKTFYSTKENSERLVTVQQNLAYLAKAQGRLVPTATTRYAPPYAISNIDEKVFNFTDEKAKEKLIQIINLSEEFTIYASSLGRAVLSCKVRLFEEDQN